MNVNTNPATDDEKWYISFTFRDSAGALIGETKLPIDQSVATSAGWVADTNGVGGTILPKDSWTTTIKFAGGKDATGTVWVDDFIFLGRGGEWAGEIWNNSVAYPAGWIDWLPPNGGKDGQYSNGYENTVVTDEESHSGMYSLKFDLPFDRAPHDGFVGTRRFLFANATSSISTNQFASDISTLADVSPGDVVRISVWLKGSNLVPDSAAAYPVTWAPGFTYAFWKGNGNNDGWNPAPGGDPVDMQFVLPNVTDFDWRQFSIDVPVPDSPETRGISVRLHVYSRFTGTLYWDDLKVEKLDVTDVDDGLDAGLPRTMELANNYPNPFNPSTNIRFALPRAGNVKLVIYNMLGQKVKTLIDETRSAGRYEVTWNGTDEQGQFVGTGLYFYQIKTEEAVLTKKMLLIK